MTKGYGNLQILEKLKYNPHDRTKFLPKHTDKIILPERILQNLVDLQKSEDLQSLPHPLVFRLSTPSRNTYVGVKEFHDKDENTLFISEDVAKRLDLKCPVDGKIQNIDDGQMDITDDDNDENDDNSIILSLELALNVSGFDDGKTEATIELSPRENYRVHDWKTFLEATLSNRYTAITTNDVLSFEIENTKYVLDVVSVKTSENIRTVCVVDRDIELVIRTIDSPQEKNDVDRGTPFGEYVDLFGDKKGEMKVTQRVKLNLQPGEVFVAQHDGEFLLGFDQFVDSDRFEYGSMINHLKEWINKTDDEISIFVYGLGSEYDDGLHNLEFTIVKMTDGEEEGNVEVAERLDDDSIRCQYCHNVIKKSSQILHENFCRRNNILCPKGCGKVFLKHIPDSHWHCCSTYGDTEWSHQLHNQYFHQGNGDFCENLGIDITCSICNEYHCLNKYTLAQHKSRDCPNSLHECRYCHLILPRGQPTNESRFYGVSSHEWECGSKTTECHKCKKIIKLRDLEMHMKLHDLERLDKPIPIKCNNLLCVNTIKLEDSNMVGLCQDCFGSLYSTVLDPEGKKLMQRIERRYILQIKNGCGNKNCNNELCGSSQNCKVPMEIRESMASIVKFVKNEIMTKIKNEGLKFQFCVSNTMCERKNIISMFEGGDWALGWVCRSNEVVGNNIDGMTQWLENNAVRNAEYL